MESRRQSILANLNCFDVEPGTYVLQNENEIVRAKLVRTHTVKNNLYGVIEFNAEIPIKLSKAAKNHQALLNKQSKITIKSELDVCIDGNSPNGTVDRSVILQLHGDAQVKWSYSRGEYKYLKINDMK